MDRLAELLANLPDLASLSDSDLASLKSELEHAARTARESEMTGETVTLIKGAAEQVVAIRGEIEARNAEAARIIAEADEALALLDEAEAGEGEGDENADIPVEGDAPETTPPAAEAPASETPTADAPAEAPTQAAPVAVAAAQGEPAKPPARRPAVKVPARHKPRVTAHGPALIAASGVRNIGAGQQFDGMEQVHRAMLEKWVSLRASADGRPNTIATIDYRGMYPEEQQLSNGDPNEVLEKVYSYLEARKSERQSLLASGGVPGPPEPRYTQITYGQADRPLRDALPSFLANRGQIIFNQSPTLADIVLDTALGAIGTVTSAQDLAGATKDVQEISAPSATTVTVEAETMRFQQGNFADKFYPERMRAFQALGMVAFARHNEALRLADIKTGSVKYTDTPAAFGAYRDLKRQFLGITEEIEDLVRDFGLPMRVLMPETVPAMLAADLTAQQPGDETYKITEEQVRAEMQSWDPDVTFTWMHDSIRGRLTTNPSGQSPRTPGFDNDVEWAIFPEGTWLFLDGGQLDLGIVRDSTLNATNKFQTFFESWEAVARIAPLSYWVTSSLCSDGASQAAAAVNVCNPQGS